MEFPTKYKKYILIFLLLCCLGFTVYILLRDYNSKNIKADSSGSSQSTPIMQPIGDWNPGRDFAQKPVLLDHLNRLNLSLPLSFWTSLDNSLANFQTIRNFQIASTGENYLLDNSKQIDLIQTQQGTPEVTSIPTGTSYFYTADNSHALYLADNPQTLDQTLYSLDLAGRPFSPIALTTFLRRISRYELIPDKSFTRIALLDQSDPDKVGLYVIDLKDKTRKLIVSEPNIMAFRWMERDFLIQKRNPVTFQTEIYRGSIDNSTLELTQMRSELSSMLPINEHELIFASPIGDSASSTIDGFNLEKINLTDGTVTTLYTASDLPIPTKIQYDPTGSRLLFLSADTIYSLTLTL